MLQGRVITTEECLSRSGVDNSAAKVLPAGTVLMSIFATIGRTAVLGVDAATNQAIVGITPRDLNVLLPEFLRRFLDSQAPSLQRKARGVAQANINSSLLKAVPVPLPPLPEQRRIAEILDKADVLRAKRRAALAQLDTLTQSIFLDMFGDPATNPKGWPRRPLGEVAIKFSDGPFGSNLKSGHYTETGVRVVRLQNIGVGVFVDDDAAYISENHFAKLRKHECLPGDVLVGTLGDPNLRACIQPTSLPVALNKADCVQIRPNPAIATAEFVCALLNQPATECMAQELMHGQTRVRISMGRLRGLCVPMPPVEPQRKFTLRVTAVQLLGESHLRSISEINKLFAALQHCAFKASS
jgi:type I restriction enzyme S subunit